MSQLSDNLTKRMHALGMDVQDVVDGLARLGVIAAYSTVAGWLNGSRGGRWKVDELKALLDVLQTDIDAMAGSAEVVEAPIPAVIAREAQHLDEAQQQLVLAMVRSLANKQP